MASNLFTDSGEPASGSAGASQKIRTQFAGIEAGLDKLAKYYIPCHFEDLNTAKSQWVVAPIAGEITGVHVVNDLLNNTAATAITLELAGVAVTLDSACEVGATDVAGTVNSAVASAANTVAALAPIEVITDGAGGASGMSGQVLVEVTIA